LEQSVSNQVLAGFTLATPLWPRVEFQNANRAAALQLSHEGERLKAAALTNGFAGNSMALTEGILNTWRLAAESTNVFWPTNDMSRWIFEKLVARNATNLYALGLLYLPTNSPTSDAALDQLSTQLSKANVILSGWELLGGAILSSVKSNLWKLLLPMVGLVLLSLWLAFRRPAEILLSLAILFLSGIILLAVMRIFGWSWNLLNLMALPLILGTGVDYSIFMQLALRRHHGDLHIAHRSVGRALLLCGATAVSGFGALGFSSNAGMASLGQVCAVGIACNMLISVLLLPIWWRKLTMRRDSAKPNSSDPETQNSKSKTQNLSAPSSLYRSELWRMGLWIVRLIPRCVCLFFGFYAIELYWRFCPGRREIVIQNLMPALNNDRAAATKKAKRLFHQFAIKVVDLWRYEAGLPIENTFGNATGWKDFTEAQAQKRGVLLLTPHLGNWEFGGPWLTQRGVTLYVVTLAEPGEKFTQLRQASRARWNIETLVIGNDPFAFLEIIRRLEAGDTVALLIDRPIHSGMVTVELFGHPFSASVAAAELARASGCVLLPVYLPREGDSYAAHVLPAISYDRASLRDPAARKQLTQQIVHAFEPAILKHLDQWYHFIPIWPKEKK
jgi:lauroyl/myristoyl acyltransferase/preprotein translocase subunit SecF